MPYLEHPAAAAHGSRNLLPPSPSVVSVVSPVYGCEQCLEELVERISATLAPATMAFEIVLVDDASPGDAWARIVELTRLHPCVRGVRLTRNFGQHAAIAAGLQYARGDRVIVMDCDLQDVPEEIPRLLQALDTGVEVALGSRVQRQDSPLKRTGSILFYRLLGWLTETRYDATTANFGAYTRKVVDTLAAMPETDRFFPLLVRWTGFRTELVPVSHGARTHGRSSYSLGRLLRLAVNVVLSYSDKPLRLVVKIGLVFSFLALCFVAFSVYRYAVGDVQIAGFTSIVASVWLVGSMLMVSIGVVGLYVGRLYNQAKRRPTFVVAEAVGET